MKDLSERNRIFGTLVGVVTFLYLTGCEGNWDVSKWTEQLNQLRVNALKASDLNPYRKEQFEALKAYFAEVTQTVYTLEQEPKLVKRFNDSVAKVDLAETCEKVFIKKQDWLKIMERCTKNSFFLCAEDVRSYADAVQSLRSKLVPEQQFRFDQTPSCKAALEGPK